MERKWLSPEHWLWNSEVLSSDRTLSPGIEERPRESFPESWWRGLILASSTVCHPDLEPHGDSVIFRLSWFSPSYLIGCTSWSFPPFSPPPSYSAPGLSSVVCRWFPGVSVWPAFSRELQIIISWQLSSFDATNRLLKYRVSKPECVVCSHKYVVTDK